MLWHDSRRFCARELRDVDVLGRLLDVAARCQQCNACGDRLSIVLAELFNNALDHGLLGLDSSLKLRPDGMEAYMGERQLRLARLTEGEIECSIELYADAGKRWLRVVCRDSGPGFQARAAGPADDLPYGRGLMLVRALATGVDFNAVGNQVTVTLPIES